MPYSEAKIKTSKTKKAVHRNGEHNEIGTVSIVSVKLSMIGYWNN